MATWKLTDGLQNLRAQVNTVFPDRDRTSDGSIGDIDHQSSTSSHNPDDTPGSRAGWTSDSDSTPEVRAWDMDADLRTPGVTAQQVVDHIRRLPGVSSVIRYMIYDRRMYHARDGFAPTAYAGPSPHTEHIHFEGAWTQTADGNTSFDYHLEDLVALTAEDKKWIQQQLDARVGDVVPRYDAAGKEVAATDPNPKMTAASALGYLGRDMGFLKATLGQLAGKDFTDEPAIIAGVLAGLPPEVIVAAIPDELAEQVADELGARLSRPPADS